MDKKPLPYPNVLFDWGDTVMQDNPALPTPMVEWQKIKVVEGIAEVLQYLHASGRRIIMATSASVSDEGQIRGALARVDLNSYFSQIYCFKNTYLQKSEAFYQHVLGDLGASAADALMVGDSFEKDVQIPNTLGVFAVWFNPVSDERFNDELHVTVHSMQELHAFFNSLDSGIV